MTCQSVAERIIFFFMLGKLECTSLCVEFNILPAIDEMTDLAHTTLKLVLSMTNTGAGGIRCAPINLCSTLYRRALGRIYSGSY